MVIVWNIKHEQRLINAGIRKLTTSPINILWTQIDGNHLSNTYWPPMTLCEYIVTGE